MKGLERFEERQCSAQTRDGSGVGSIEELLCHRACSHMCFFCGVNLECLPLLAARGPAVYGTRTLLLAI